MASTTEAPKLIYLGHIKKSEPVAAKPSRMAWTEGAKIVSNKEEALLSFLRRKLKKGETLTPEQLEHVRKHAPTVLDALNEPPTPPPEAATGGAGATASHGKSVGGGKRKRGDGSTSTTAGAAEPPAKRGATAASPAASKPAVPSLSTSAKLSMSLDDLLKHKVKPATPPPAAAAGAAAAKAGTGGGGSGSGSGRGPRRHSPTGKHKPGGKR